MEENVVCVQFYKKIPHWTKNYITRDYKVSLFVFFLQIPYPRHLLATFGDRKPVWIDLGSVFFMVKKTKKERDGKAHKEETLSRDYGKEKR